MDADPDAELRERLTHALVFADAAARSLRDSLALLDERRRLHQLEEEGVQASGAPPREGAGS